MIEMIYKEQTKENGLERKLILPKNVRQIGEPGEKRKIYIEDYVLTYLKRLTREQMQEGRAAILLGNSERKEGVPYLFIRSAVELKNLEITGAGVPFTDEIWAQIYENIKEYFMGQDILGWFLSAPGYFLDYEKQLTRTHINYFGGVDKVLMVSEPLDNEEEFYAYESGKLMRQRGYYIFYERNEAMQRYMVETGTGESIDEKDAFEDRAIKNFRAIVQEKKELSGQRRVMTFLYAASTFLVMVVLVIGITLINNYEKMEGLEMTLSEISQSLEEQQMFGETMSGNALEESQEATNESVYISDEMMAEMEQENELSRNEDTRQEEMGPDSVSQEAFSDQVLEIPESYVVKQGDTLHGICRKLYGNDDRMREICELNDIDDSDRILAGQKLLLP